MFLSKSVKSEYMIYYDIMSQCTIYVEVPRTYLLDIIHIKKPTCYYKICYSTRVYFAGESATPNDKKI